MGVISSNLARYSTAPFNSYSMAPMKAMGAKAMKGGKPMTKSEIAKTIAEEYELKQKVCSDIIATLAETAGKELKKNGKFVFPGFCMVKTRLKPATKAGKREVFGKMVMVKARPARTVVKAFPVSALKKSV